MSGLFLAVDVKGEDGRHDDRCDVFPRPNGA